MAAVFAVSELWVIGVSCLQSLIWSDNSVAWFHDGWWHLKMMAAECIEAGGPL